MSISALTTDFTKKYVDVKEDERFIAQAERLAADFSMSKDDILSKPAFQETARDEPVQSGKASNAFDALTKYIPTETVTLYLAAVSSLPALKEVLPTIASETTVYVSFIFLTAVLVLLLSWVRRRENNESIFYNWGNRGSKAEYIREILTRFPLWRMFAAALAFAIWALAVPNNPLLQGEASMTVAAFAALLTSTLLNVIEPLMEVSPPKSKE